MSPGVDHQIKSPLILVVDDDRITRKLVVKHLIKAGYQVIEAENGQQCVDLFDEHHPSIVLMDVMMPVMNGFEACEALRERVADLSLPIIMLTGLDDVAAVEKSFESGATDFVSKPFNWPLLIQRVKFAFRDRSMFLELQEKQRQLADAQRIAKLGYGYMNLTTGDVSMSLEIMNMLGIEGDGHISREQFMSMLSVSDQERMQECIEQAMLGNGQYTVEHNINLPNGSSKVILQRGEIHNVNGDMIVHGALQDITEQSKAEERIMYHTYYDILTGLPNRTMLDHQLNEKIEVKKPFAMLFVGIDRFKAINDSLGHHRGDLLLESIAERLQPLQDSGCFVSRFGGDLFAILIYGVESPEPVSETATEILKLISAPIYLEGNELVVNVSIGAALYPYEADSAHKLLLGADTAMNVAKENGGNQFRFFSAEMDEQSQQRLALEQDLRRALKNNEFEVYYQPQFCARSQTVVGMEALVRWMHPQRGMISPGLFIPLAEEVGLVTDLGEWVLNTSARQAAEWHGRFYDIRLGVNLSVKQLQLENIQELVSDAIEHSGIAPHLLELEITESMAVSDYENTISTLNKISSLGAKISMDDFGTGYSSLSYLQKLPINTLKIDRAFIKDITDDGDNGEIAKAIIALSQSLGLHTIAEGIETQGQYEYLREHGVDEIQGFYFSKPLPADEFERLLNGRHKKTGAG